MDVNTNYTIKLKDNIIPKKIALYDQEYNSEVLQNARFLEGSVTDDLKMMEHPLENGAMIVDHIIDDPKKATVKVLIDDSDFDTLNELLDLYRNRVLLVVRIKNELYTDLCISSKPVKADVGYYDSAVYDLAFKEVMFAQTVYVKMSVPQVKQKKNASTVKTGQKQPQKPKKSILAKIKKKLGK